MVKAGEGVSSGLGGVVAAETVLSDVDGARGRLVIRGHALETPDGHRSFEDVTALLLDGFFALGGSIALGQARVEAWTRFADLRPDGETMADALRRLAAPAVLTPALIRVRAGAGPIAPGPALGHAADVLRMLERTSDDAAALDAYLVTVCAHGLNASTFAARVVASTRAGLARRCWRDWALKGPLHGGAPGPVIAMLDAIAAAGDARGWLTAVVARLRSPNTWRGLLWRCCTAPGRIMCWRPMSSSTPRCCWRRWASRRRRSRLCSRWGGRWAGSRTRASRRRAGA